MCLVPGTSSTWNPSTDWWGRQARSGVYTVRFWIWAHRHKTLAGYLQDFPVTSLILCKVEVFAGPVWGDLRVKSIHSSKHPMGHLDSQNLARGYCLTSSTCTMGDLNMTFGP